MNGDSKIELYGKITRLEAEIERLRGVLVEANNRWRHEFSQEVENAADKLFGKLAAHRTDPFGRRTKAEGE